MPYKKYLLCITILLMCFVSSNSTSEPTTENTSATELPESKTGSDASSGSTLEIGTASPLQDTLGSSTNSLATAMSGTGSTSFAVGVTGSLGIDASYTSTSEQTVTNGQSTVSSAIASMTDTTATTETTVTGSYKYKVSSESELLEGTINNTEVFANVTELVRQSFTSNNILSYMITSIKIERRERATKLLYWMTVGIIFKTNNSCDKTCIDKFIQLQNITISLQGKNGTIVPAVSEGISTEANTSPVEIRRGGPSPGIPAQLGMGLGISIIGVLLAAEVIFLYRKYGLSNARQQRQRQYAMTAYS